MCSPTAAVVGGTLALSAYSKYKGSKDAAKAGNQAAEYNADVAEKNASMSRIDAAWVMNQSKIDVKKHRSNVEDFKSQQRLNTAGSGVVVDTGSALKNLQDTAALGEIDAMTMQSNAERSARNIRLQGENYQSQAGQYRAGQVSANRAGFISLLDSSSRAAQTYASYKGL